MAHVVGNLESLATRICRDGNPVFFWADERLLVIRTNCHPEPSELVNFLKRVEIRYGHFQSFRLPPGPLNFVILPRDEDIVLQNLRELGVSVHSRESKMDVKNIVIVYSILDREFTRTFPINA